MKQENLTSNDYVKSYVESISAVLGKKVNYPTLKITKLKRFYRVCLYQIWLDGDEKIKPSVKEAYVEVEKVAKKLKDAGYKKIKVDLNYLGKPEPMLSLYIPVKNS